MPKTVAIKDYMSASLVSFRPDMDILKAISLLVQHRISGGPVLDRQGNLVGELSEKDCLKVALQSSYHSESAGTVSEYMHTEIKTVDANTNIADIAGMFVRDGYRRYPVMKDNRLVGQISRHDVLRALQTLWD